MYSRIKQLNRFTDMIQIRPSQLSDLDRLMEIFDHARKFMASVGNGNQWINGYPQRELIAKEITDGHCYFSNCFVEVNDVDTIAFHENIRSHCRIPLSFEVTKVATGFQ